jgi:hypothetical protein
MKPLWPPAKLPLYGLFINMDRMKAAFVMPSIALLCAALFSLVFRRDIWSNRLFPMAMALLLFPFVQVGMLCLLSDWGVWPWYYYPFVYSSIGAFLVFLTPQPDNTVEVWQYTRWALAVPTAFYVLFVSVYAFDKQPSSIALIAADLAGWMRQHPGTYAMGDEAGTTAYISGQPIVQMEGLVMDRNFLNRIRRREPLAHVLSDYGVHYYTVLYIEPVNGCYDLHEPSNAGSASPHMLGQVCAAPLFTSTHSGSTASLFDANAVH